MAFLVFISESALKESPDKDLPMLSFDTALGILGLGPPPPTRNLHRDRCNLIRELLDQIEMDLADAFDDVPRGVSQLIMARLGMIHDKLDLLQGGGAKNGQ